MDEGVSCTEVSRRFWVRKTFSETRYGRDIPLPLVTSGCENSGNLRELALNRMKDFGAECRDVRFREVGVSAILFLTLVLSDVAQIHEIHHKVRPESVELLRRDYTANGGWETFLSYEDPERDILVGLLRLRKCSEEGTFRPELVKKDGDEGGCSIVRELHVYGTAVPVHGRDPTKFQHQVRLLAFALVRRVDWGTRALGLC